jgi:AraC-like DNA-binding protein
MGASLFKEMNSVSLPTAKRISIKKSVRPEEAASNMLALLYPVPPLQTIPQGTVVFTIKESDFSAKFANIFGDFQGSIWIYDPYYTPLVSIGHDMDSIDSGLLDERLRTIRGTGISSLSVDGSDLVVDRMVSGEMGWSYMIAMPESFFFKRVYTIKLLLIGLMFILIMLGFLVAVLFSFRNYRPIQSLLSFLKKQEYGGIRAEGRNELETIRSSFENALKQIDAQRPYLRGQFLLTLLKGKTIPPEERADIIRRAELTLEGQAFYCMAVSVKSGNEEGQVWNQITALLEHVVLVGGHAYGVEAIGENLLVVVVIMQEPPHEAATRQKAVVGSLLGVAGEELQSSLKAGIGKIYGSLEQINCSYLEAVAALYDNQANDRLAAYFFDDMENVQEQVYWYPIKEQALYIQSLKLGNPAVAVESLERLLERITSGTASFLMVRCLCFDVVNQVLKLINQMNFRGFGGDLKELMKWNTMQEFQAEMAALTVWFCEQVNSFKEKKNTELKNRLISYIDLHFRDSNLSLEQIAGEFGLSATFVSRFIKEETGVNFLDYLTCLRMNEVKAQLQNTDKQIQEIVTDVGYLNTPSFVRKFKAKEGVTPSQYRQIVGKV